MSQFPWRLFKGAQEIVFPKGARRRVRSNVSPLPTGGAVELTIDDSLVWTGGSGRQRYQVDLSCSDQTTAPLGALKLGDVVVLEAPFEIALPGPIATLPHDPVPGTVYGVNAEDMPVGSTASGSRSVNISGAVAIRYRPILSCMIADFRTDGEHRRAAEGWSMSLWEMQGDETSTDEGGESLTFAAPGLQAFTVGVPVSVNLAPFASTTTGLPIQFAIAAGSFPPGVSVSLAGMITGTPTAAGVYAPVVFAASGTVGAMQTVPFYAALPTITTTGLVLQEYTVGTPYTLDVSPLVNVENTSEELVFSLPPGSLPAGLSVSSAGVISGTPTEYGAFSATFHVELSTGQSADVTVAFFAQNPDALPDAVILGGTAQAWLESVAGGSTTYDAADFTASGVLTVLEAGWTEYILVGGGGGGASVSSTAGGGGGGAGGFRRERIYLPVGTYSVSIGGGGGAGFSGSLTSFDSGPPINIGRTCSGGGRGGTTTQSGIAVGASGGGGGGSGSTAGTGGVASQTDYGSNGGNGSVGTAARGGGGGGYSTQGETPSTVRAGVGGGGIKVRLWDVLEFCGGGGGGAGNGVSGSNGLSRNGGGHGGASGGSGFAAEANTGGGGGGAGGGASGSRTGGAGGSGRAIFIVKRRTAS